MVEMLGLMDGTLRVTGVSGAEQPCGLIMYCLWKAAEPFLDLCFGQESELTPDMLQKVPEQVCTCLCILVWLPQPSPGGHGLCLTLSRVNNPGRALQRGREGIL